MVVGRHTETCWCNDDVNNSVNEKPKLQNKWKERNTSKKNYSGAKRKARTVVFQAKCGVDLQLVIRRGDQKGEIFRITKRMVKTSQDVISERCIRNDDFVLLLSYEDKKIAWKKKLIIVNFFVHNHFVLTNFDVA